MQGTWWQRWTTSSKWTWETEELEESIEYEGIIWGCVISCQLLVILTLFSYMQLEHNSDMKTSMQFSSSLQKTRVCLSLPLLDQWASYSMMFKSIVCSNLCALDTVLVANIYDMDSFAKLLKNKSLSVPEIGVIDLGPDPELYDNLPPLKAFGEWLLHSLPPSFTNYLIDQFQIEQHDDIRKPLAFCCHPFTVIVLIVPSIIVNFTS